MDEDMLCEQLSQFYLAEKSAVSLEKLDTNYILHLDAQSCGSGAKIAASSTDNTVRLYSRDTLAYSHVISAHKKTVTGVQFSHNDPNLLYSCSVDATIRSWDIRTKGSTPAVVYEVGSTSDTITDVSTFDLSCDGSMICAGTEAEKEDVYLLFWDSRMSESLGVYSECHHDDIAHVRFHPTNKNHLITGSTDNLVCLFDISEACEDDALLSTFNCQSSVSRIGWCGNKNNNIYGLTHFNTLHIWDTVEFDPVLELVNIIAEDAQTMDYLVDCFQTFNDELYLVAGSYSGTMSILHIEDQIIVPNNAIQHKGHNGVIRCIHWDNETKSLVTGGEDAMLCLWKTEHQEQPTCPADTLKAKSRLKSNRKHQKRLSDDRPTNSTPNTSSSSAGMGICGSKMQSHDNTDRRKMESPEEIKLMESEEEDSDDHSDSQKQVVNWEDRSLMYEGDNDCYITSIRKPWDISCVVLSDDEVPSEA